MAKGCIALIPNEVNIYSLHTNNITKIPGKFDKPLIGQICIDNWIDKKMIGYYNIARIS